MIYPPAFVVAYYLNGQGLVSTSNQNDDWSVQVNYMPDEAPDNRVAVFDSFSREDGETLEDGKTTVHPGIQIRVRGSTGVEAYDKAESIRRNLEAALRAPVNIAGQNFLIQAFTVRTPPIFLQTEEKNLRKSYVVNGFITYEELP